MGLMSKFKNMFTEEIEDEPIKKEVIQVEIPAPAKVEKEVHEEIKLESVKPEPKKEIELSKPPVQEEKEEKFTFPVFFDDKDFDTIEKPKKEIKPERKVEPYSGKGLEVPREKPKTFRPTPVISPVFGVLDKNYKKEDITDKTEVHTEVKHGRTVSIDDIRKKAYGTLEDDLENSLLENDFYEEPAVYRSEKDMFDDFDLLEEEPVKESAEELMDFAPPLHETRESRFEHSSEDKLPTEESDTLETLTDGDSDDLFDLIDSMYEKGDKQS